MNRPPSVNEGARAPGAPDAAATAQALAAWPAIDATWCMRWFRGDAIRYLGFLIRLRAMLEALLPELHQAGQAGERATLQRLAHEIQGAAANLGAVHVAAAAATLNAGPLDSLDATTLESRVAALSEAIDAFGRGLAAVEAGQPPAAG